ncbi:membrane protein [Pseudonocardia eucalypti]|uniref:Membrane protein n=1 Tax=Pseudonocardia eucalypti TaxID=648755 RepID=A0ABP9Q9T1_9PSEU
MTPKLTPVSLARRPVSRLIQLIVGLTLYGVSMAFMIRAGLGLDPWDVLHQGLANHVPLSFGTITALVGALVLLAWWPLRQRPGIGTVANILVIAVAVDGALAVLPAATSLWWQVPLMVLGVVLNGVATACYVGARLGPGPRDGLMTGLHARTGKSVRLVRTGIEVAVLATGWLLGGTVGVGTVLYALSIGPLTQFFLPWLAYRDGAAATTPPPAG